MISQGKICLADGTNGRNMHQKRGSPITVGGVQFIRDQHAADMSLISCRDFQWQRSNGCNTTLRTQSAGHDTIRRYEVAFCQSNDAETHHGRQTLSIDGEPWVRHR